MDFILIKYNYDDENGVRKKCHCVMVNRDNILKKLMKQVRTVLSTYDMSHIEVFNGITTSSITTINCY